MQPYSTVQDLRSAVRGTIELAERGVTVRDEERLRALVDRIAASSALGADDVRSAAAWLLRASAVALGAWPASIQPLYEARARDEWRGATVPAINGRFGYPQLRAIVRTALDLDVGAVIFELARSEMGYTEQRPAEYASGVYAAAIREGWRGPLFIQGDHFQANRARMAKEPDAELREIEALIDEAVAAGFYNIDIDTSTLVDLSRPTVDEQQQPNYEHAVRLASRVRRAQPPGVVISLGGEIGEVGKENSTVEELVAYMEGFRSLAAERGVEPGPSKVSVQTGTSHGGVVRPDGTVADVSIDFEVLRELSDVARSRYGMAGAVQHGASTLPDELFDEFPKLGAAEIHLATGYQNALMDSESFPTGLRDRIYARLREQFAAKLGVDYETEAQLYYKERKRCVGPFKRDLWAIDESVWDTLRAELGGVLRVHFEKLGVVGTGALVARHVRRVDVPLPPAPSSFT